MESAAGHPACTNFNFGLVGADSRFMEGNRIEDYDLDALVARFKEAEMRAFEDGRAHDASDLLIAQHLVCILRGDFHDGRYEPSKSSLRLAG